MRVMMGPARHPVPVMILARLAVDKDHQGRGRGKALLKDALLRTAQVPDIAGIRCCWCMPRMKQRGSGICRGSASQARAILTTCS